MTQLLLLMLLKMNRGSRETIFVLFFAPQIHYQRWGDGSILHFHLRMLLAVLLRQRVTAAAVVFSIVAGGAMQEAFREDPFFALMFTVTKLLLLLVVLLRLVLLLLLVLLLGVMARRRCRCCHGRVSFVAVAVLALIVHLCEAK